LNTAGVSQFGPVEKATHDDWDWQIDVNLKGMINGVQCFVPRMIERGTGGHIVNTASMSAFVALPTTAIYCTTKYAVRGLTESFASSLNRAASACRCVPAA
jgi:NADP-dependent 3-hydroxy acid dehydrogenase YdfG